jgi:dCMP deaminase
MDWDSYFIGLLDPIAGKSKDPSTQCGCVIVGPGHEIRSTGFNGFPRGVDESDPERWQRPAKYMLVEHAERNAIYNAARNGVALVGCTLYVSAHPCEECAKAIIQSGIARVVFREASAGFDERWAIKIQYARLMLDEAGVKIEIHQPIQA